MEKSACYEPQGQTCKVCGHRDKFDFTIPDDIWRAALPEEYHNRVVCLSCFDNFAYHKEVDYATSLRHLYFAGHQGTVIFVIERALNRKEFKSAPYDDRHVPAASLALHSLHNSP